MSEEARQEIFILNEKDFFAVLEERRRQKFWTWVYIVLAAFQIVGLVAGMRETHAQNSWEIEIDRCYSEEGIFVEDEFKVTCERLKP